MKMLILYQRPIENKIVNKLTVGLMICFHLYDTLEKPARLLRSDKDLRESFHGTIQDLKLVPGFAAAVAVET